MGIRKIGKKTGIVTGAPVHIADFYVDELMGRDLFDSVTFARKSSGLEKKPNPQALLACIDELGLRKRDAIYTGNSEEDVDMGRAAGVKTVLIDRGEHNIGESPEPPLRIRSLYELEEFI
jgi:phosphoglycolate phosphatase